MGTGIIILGLILLHVREIWSLLPDLSHNDSELEARAGYYTDNGKYRGGIPKIESEYELFGCTEFNYYYDDDDNYSGGDDAPTFEEGSTVRDANNATAAACVRWTADEVSSDAYKTDRCSCRPMNTSGYHHYYCDTWTCSRLEIDHAIPLEKEVENTRCTCHQAEENDDDSSERPGFCTAWTCLTTGIHGDRQLEDFQCTRASSSSEYCEAWTGVVKSSEQVGVSTCACVKQGLDGGVGGGVCLYWECEQRCLDKCSRGGPGWCDLGVSLGVGGFFGSLGALVAAWAIFRLLHRARHPSHQGKYGCFFLLGFLWMAVWSIGVVIWGGQDGAMYAGIWWGTLIVVDLLYGCCTNCS